MRGSLILAAVAVLAVGPLARPARAERGLGPGLGLASPFGDHMVLQRGVPVPVWGTAAPGEPVTVALGARTARATAGPEGRWMARLGPLEAGGPFTLTVTGSTAGSTPLTVVDVLVGEVWVASGQSNMDMSVAREDRYWCGVDHEAAEVAAADFPQVREFRVAVTMTDTPREAVEGRWTVCSPATVGKFSAAAYFFGRDLHQRLGVPIGLVTTTYGASTAQAWISHPALEAEPAFAPVLARYAEAHRAYAADPAVRQKYQDARQRWEAAARKAQAEGKDRPREPRNPDPEQDQHNPCVLYNGMIRPLVPYAIRGAIWYQGESNGPTADLYRDLMATLIRDWRTAWGQGDFPFLFVQLANHGKPPTAPVGRDRIPLIREAQLQNLAVPRTAMAVAIDIGDPTNIHPKNKQEVGRRLALAARALAYGEAVPYSGPQFEAMTVEGNAARLRFGQADGGLVARGAKLAGFVVAGPDGRFVWADARIEGTSVVVSSPEVPHPVAVRYAWADNPTATLYNGAGLPASPFRTDPGR